MAQTFANVLNTHFAIFVEIQSQVVVLDKHSHVAVSLCDVVDQSTLTLSKDLQKNTDKVCGFIDKENNSLVNVRNCLLDLTWELQTAVPYLVEFIDVIYVRICQFVGLRFLQVL